MAASTGVLLEPAAAQVRVAIDVSGLDTTVSEGLRRGLARHLLYLPEVLVVADEADYRLQVHHGYTGVLSNQRPMLGIIGWALSRPGAGGRALRHATIFCGKDADVDPFLTGLVERLAAVGLLSEGTPMSLRVRPDTKGIGFALRDILTGHGVRLEEDADLAMVVDMAGHLSNAPGVVIAVLVIGGAPTTEAAAPPEPGAATPAGWDLFAGPLAYHVTAGSLDTYGQALALRFGEALSAASSQAP